MQLMGLDAEYEEARAWVRESLEYVTVHSVVSRLHYSCLGNRFGKQEDINLFETTIRVVGGLLSAYELSADARFLTRAQELMDGMIFAFDRCVVVTCLWLVVLQHTQLELTLVYGVVCLLTVVPLASHAVHRASLLAR